MKPWEETVWVEPKRFFVVSSTDNNNNSSSNNNGSSEKVATFLPSYSMFMRNKHYHIVLILRKKNRSKEKGYEQLQSALFVCTWFEYSVMDDINFPLAVNIYHISYHTNQQFTELTGLQRTCHPSQLTTVAVTNNLVDTHLCSVSQSQLCCAYVSFDEPSSITGFLKKC